jgi:hypothetical protein
MPGTFHVDALPMSSNEVLWNGEISYDIQTQFGLGNYSLVWLAKTRSPTTLSGSRPFVAVKIINQNSPPSDGLELAFARKQVKLDCSDEGKVEATR